MRIIKTDDFSLKIAERSAVTIGNFDGVHRGHREIFRKVCHYASLDSSDSVVITFDPHPLELLNPENPPLLITTLAQKQELIAESGLDILIVIPFSMNFSRISAEDFLRRVLIYSLGVSSLVIGHDYAFGRNREGNEQFVRTFSEKSGFAVDSIDPVGDGGLIFSSSEVRRLVLSGDVISATRILGRCHRISGQVVHGREIGRSIGFPTANIVTENRLIPADGVYAVWVEAFGELHMGACSIGNNPTFPGGERSIEVFLFDFDGVLYGHKIVVHFAGRLRDLARFKDAAALSCQIAADVEAARKILSSGLPARLMS